MGQPNPWTTLSERVDLYIAHNRWQPVMRHTVVAGVHLLPGFLSSLFSLAHCLATAPLKLRPYGAIQICLLLLLFLVVVAVTAAVVVPSVLWRCWLGGRKGIRPVKQGALLSQTDLLTRRGHNTHQQSGVKYVFVKETRFIVTACDESWKMWQGPGDNYGTAAAVAATVNTSARPHKIWLRFPLTVDFWPLAAAVERTGFTVYSISQMLNILLRYITICACGSTHLEYTANWRRLGKFAVIRPSTINKTFLFRQSCILTSSTYIIHLVVFAAAAPLKLLLKILWSTDWLI